MVQPRAGSGTVQIALRLAPDLRDRIKAAADRNGRSVNSELIATLEEQYPAPMEAMSVSEMLDLTEAALRAPHHDPSNPEFSATSRERLERVRDQVRRIASTNPQAPFFPLPYGVVATTTFPARNKAILSEERLFQAQEHISEIFANERRRFPDEPAPSVADVLNLIEEALESMLFDPRHPHYDAEKHELLLDARDLLTERAKTEPDAPAVRETLRAKRIAAERAAQMYDPDDPGAVQRVFERGQNAFRENTSRDDNPFPSASPFHDFWDQGWQKEYEASYGK